MDTDSFVLNTDSFVLSFSEDDLRSCFPDTPTKIINNKVPGKIKHELGRKVIEEFVNLSPKTYSFKDYPDKTEENIIKYCSNAKHEGY